MTKRRPTFAARVEANALRRVRQIYTAHDEELRGIQEHLHEIDARLSALEGSSK